MSIADGTTFAGYRILRILGSGGMGEVYLAQHPRLPRRDALKVLRTDLSADPEYRARFEREADTASTLWHPHIVGVHDRGDVDGQLWIALEYVEGTDAAQLLASRYPYGMPPAEVTEIVSAIADALDYAHDNNLLHRDVKPSNILIAEIRDGERRILLADFGIAKAVDDHNNLTATNIAVGSVAYAAPEQLSCLAMDGRADQYALACTAFHLLTGAPPFVHSNPAIVIGSHLSSPPPRVANIRLDLSPVDSVLARAMAKEPGQRFKTCRAFANALREGCSEMTRAADPTQFAHATAPPPPQPPSAPPGPAAHSQYKAPSANRRPLLIAGGVAVLITIGLVAYLGARLGQPESGSPSTAPPLSTFVAPSSEGDHTVTQTAPPITVTRPGSPPGPVAKPSPAPSTPTGDLGLAQPMSYPTCNGQGIVILGSVTTPGLYAAGVQKLLAASPGAFYLRTDRSCPSLRQATDDGNPIYAVFTRGGMTQSQVCAVVRGAGEGAYGKWLDNTTDPGYIIPC